MDQSADNLDLASLTQHDGIVTGGDISYQFRKHLHVHTLQTMLVQTSTHNT